MDDAAQENKAGSGKRLVIGLVVLSLLIAFLRWEFVPRTNPRETDPGSPFYSQPKPGE